MSDSSLGVQRGLVFQGRGATKRVIGDPIIVYKDQGPATGSFNGLHLKSNVLTMTKMKQGLSLSVWHQPGDVFKAKDGKNVSICRSEDGGKTWGEEIVIAEMRGITREAGRAKKYGVVLKPSLPTDFQTGEVHDGPDGGASYEFGESAFCWFISPHWDAGKYKVAYFSYGGDSR
jgi:hypothetical protein